MILKSHQKRTRLDAAGLGLSMCLWSALSAVPSLIFPPAWVVTVAAQMATVVLTLSTLKYFNVRAVPSYTKPLLLNREGSWVPPLLIGIVFLAAVNYAFTEIIHLGCGPRCQSGSFFFGNHLGFIALLFSNFFGGAALFMVVAACVQAFRQFRYQ